MVRLSRRSIVKWTTLVLATMSATILAATAYYPSSTDSIPDRPVIEWEERPSGCLALTSVKPGYTPSPWDGRARRTHLEWSLLTIQNAEGTRTYATPSGTVDVGDLLCGLREKTRWYYDGQLFGGAPPTCWSDQACSEPGWQDR